MARRLVCGLLVAAVVVTLGAAPFTYYRLQYNHAKRLRVVTPGVLYRSGQLTEAGLEDAIARHGIRSLVNFQNEAPDPVFPSGVSEGRLCRQRGVLFYHIAPDCPNTHQPPGERPNAIAKFLAIMDDPANYPVLIHCRAGLHRTGIFAALYRMEYEDWALADAIRELKANGFGDSKCNAQNVYIWQYLLTYQKRPTGNRQQAAGNR